MRVDSSLYAVVSLPAGVFNPYSGVKTSILLLDKNLAKKSEDLLFVKVKNDGYGLGAQRREIQENDLPEALGTLQSGTVNRTAVFPRKIAERGLCHGSAGVIISHNPLISRVFSGADAKKSSADAFLGKKA